MNNRQEIYPFDYIELFRKNLALMVTMDKDKNLNVMTLARKEIEEIEGRPVIRAQVEYSRYTYTLLTKGINEYTINVPSEKINNAIQIAGFYSGRDIDKFQKAGLEIIPGKKTEIPTLKDCILNYECKIIQVSKSNLSNFDYFYGEIQVAYASNDIIK